MAAERDAKVPVLSAPTFRPHRQLGNRRRTAARKPGKAGQEKWPCHPPQSDYSGSATSRRGRCGRVPIGQRACAANAMPFGHRRSAARLRPSRRHWRAEKKKKKKKTFPIACTPIPALPACGACPIPFTPAGANPAALSPQPPARHLGVTRPVRVLQCATDALPLRHQPAVPPAKVDMRHGKAPGSSGNGRRLIFHGPPEIRNEPARIAYDLKRGSARRGKQHGSRPAERFDVFRRRPEPSPNVGRN